MERDRVVVCVIGIGDFWLFLVVFCCGVRVCCEFLREELCAYND